MLFLIIGHLVLIIKYIFDIGFELR